MIGCSHFLHEGESRFRRQLKSAVNGNATVQRFRFNTSLVEPVEPGRWFLALYNDDDVAQQVAVSLTLTTEVTTPCPDDCNGRGHCVSGKCICRDGFAGTDCSTSNATLFLTSIQSEPISYTSCSNYSNDSLSTSMKYCNV